MILISYRFLFRLLFKIYSIFPLEGYWIPFLTWASNLIMWTIIAYTGVCFTWSFSFISFFPFHFRFWCTIVFLFDILPLLLLQYIVSISIWSEKQSHHRIENVLWDQNTHNCGSWKRSLWKTVAMSVLQWEHVPPFTWEKNMYLKQKEEIEQDLEDPWLWLLLHAQKVIQQASDNVYGL